MAIEDECVIVVKFYCFSCHLTTYWLKEKLEYVVYQGNFMFVPFFKEDILPDLPTDLNQALEEAEAQQTCKDKDVQSRQKCFG
jgi:hypothetical protein